MLSSKNKEKIIAKSRIHDKDTGSSPVQVAILNERIDLLTKHLQKNKKDEHSRRGLIKLVAKRRTHEKYLNANKKSTRSWVDFTSL